LVSRQRAFCVFRIPDVKHKFFHFLFLMVDNLMVKFDV
jgi:hypothetical protein